MSLVERRGARLCILAGIPGIPMIPQEPDSKKRNDIPFFTGTSKKAGQTAQEPQKTCSFFAGTMFSLAQANKILDVKEDHNIS
jgi:hypothetical protein